MKNYLRLLILLSLYKLNAFFINNGFPKFRCVSERNYKKDNTGKIYIIDIDGTICHTKKSDYYNSIPIKDNIKFFNELYNNGNTINYWTARGAKSGKNWDKYTVTQLEKWGVKYSSINLGKPHYDVWIDDKAINVYDLNI